MKILHRGDYAKRRREHYPSVGEQLDALWKGGPEAQRMRERIEAVKRRFPKPE